jgi:hypothetical protein
MVRPLRQLVEATQRRNRPHERAHKQCQSTSQQVVEPAMGDVPLVSGVHSPRR